ncbi:type III toxin-antitoxin system ToxN/AbiQ family toxin, partial [Lachnospiraceae bacterium 38-14]
MDWYVVDKKYINYLTQFDSRVGYVEYGERLKLHVGILLTIGDFGSVNKFVFLEINGSFLVRIRICKFLS